MVNPMQSRWFYSRSGSREGLEIGQWASSNSLALSPHLHDEVQITRVFSGERRFITQFGTIDVEQGYMIAIPSGAPHASVNINRPCSTVNFYIPREHPAVLELQAPLVLKISGAKTINHMLDLIGSAYKPSSSLALDRQRRLLIETVIQSDSPICEIAAQHDFSTEAFIRLFSARVGLTPGAYRIAHRLRISRAYLSQGMTPVHAALDAGFADQSHLGRHFRRAFGTTPGAYRAAMAFET
jgi:AraC-like DNA-binding protein